MNKLLLTPLIMILSLTLADAQDYKLSKGSEIKFSGTSSLHDWTMVVENSQGKGFFIVENNEVKEISKLKLNIEAESMKSGKSGMDENAYKASSQRVKDMIAIDIAGRTKRYPINYKITPLYNRHHIPGRGAGYQYK